MRRAGDAFLAYVACMRFVYGGIDNLCATSSEAAPETTKHNHQAQQQHQKRQCGRQQLG